MEVLVFLGEPPSPTVGLVFDEDGHGAAALFEVKRFVQVLGGRVAFLRVEKDTINSQLMGVAEAGHEQLATNTPTLDSWMDGQPHDLG